MINPQTSTPRSERIKAFLYEFWMFGLKHAQACVFAGSFLAVLLLSKLVFTAHHNPLFGFLYRYDFLFLAALGIQALLLRARLETWEDVRVIFLFHVIGFCLEVFKTNPAIGSWSYPEPGYLKLFQVPLYSGFMYSAVGSFINHAWHLFKLRIEHHPPYWVMLLISFAIYLNFFTHHFLPDVRYYLMVLVLLLMWKTRVYFTVIKTPRVMPLVLGFSLIGFFIWVAENIATLFGAWQYPNQTQHWVPVSLDKVNCWFLLVIISFNIVSTLHRGKNMGD